MEEFKKPDSVYSATISTITGKLAGDKTPSGNRVTGLFAVKPTKYESAGKEVTVDSLCNGKVTDDTPTEAIKTGILVDLEPIVESYDPSWVASTKNWVGSHAGDDNESDGGYITSYKDEVCVRPSSDGAVISFDSSLVDGSTRPLGKSAITVKYNSANPIKRIRLLQ